MNVLGKVEFILNENQILISSNKPLDIDQVLIVFQQIEIEDVKKKLKLEHIGIPKGFISVLFEESENIYLAEIFQESKEKKRIISHPSRFDQLTSGALTKLFDIKREEIIDLAPGEWSGKLDKEKSLNIKIKAEITVGDIIGLS